MLTILFVYLIAREWKGATAGLWAGGLLAFNEYHIGISSFAVEKSYYLCFVMGYPLDSGNPNILWLGSRGLSVPVGDDRSIRRWVHGDCLLHKAVEEFSPAA